MKRKCRLKVFLLVLSIMLPAFSSSAYALVLNVPERFQQYDQWCWAGVSQSIFNYYGRSITQSTIANYGTNGYNVWNYLYGSDSVSPYYRKGINMILNNWGLTCTYGEYTMSQAQIQSRINAYQPFVIRWGWTTGGGHFVTGRGYSGNYVYIMNPGAGHGYEIGTYAWVVNDGSHTWTHSLELTSSPPTSSIRAPLQLYAGDFNGDQYSDIAIFRSSTGLWSIRGVGRGYFGRAGDIPVPADYNGDGTADIAIFRPSTGLWSVRGRTRFYFGGSGDYPIPMNYHSGYTTAGIFRPSTGLWSFRGGNRLYFGRSGDIPVPGPYKTRNGQWGAPYIAVFRPSTGLWSIKGLTRFYFGRSGDTPVPGDYQSSQSVSTRPWRAAIFRPSTGLWSIRGVGRAYFGGSGDTPVPADYSGGWGDEIAIFRPSTGLWSIKNGGRYYFGGSGDSTPVR